MEDIINDVIEEHSPTSNVINLVDKKIKSTDDVKSAIDYEATRTALQQEGTISKIVEEKQEELRNDAEAKRIESETEKYKKEVAKIKQEKEKELAELDKIISSKQKEVEQLKTEGDKAQAYFISNKEILKYVGIREKKTLKVMNILMIPATIFFLLVQIILFPITLSGLVLESMVGIIGGICGAIKNSAIKIIVAILIGLLICGVVVIVYYFGGKLIMG